MVMEATCACSGLQRICSWPSLGALPSPRPHLPGGARPPLPAASEEKMSLRLPSALHTTQQHHLPHQSPLLSSLPALPQQGACLVQAPLAPVPATSRAGSFAAVPVSNPLQVQAVFQYISLPSFSWLLWGNGGSRATAPAPASPAANAAGAASVPSSLPGSSSTGTSIAGTSSARDKTPGAASGISAAGSSSGGANNSSGSRVRTAAASPTAAAAIVASELSPDAALAAARDAASLLEDLLGPADHQPQKEDAPQKRSTSWFVSFLVNYSLVMSAWWQFKHTAPQIVQQWFEQTVPPFVPKLHLALPHLPSIPIPHHPVPLPLLVSALALPFNPLLEHALLPINLLRGLRPPWLPPATELTPSSGRESGEALLQREKELDLQRWAGGSSPSPENGNGESDEDERVEALVVDDMEPGMFWGQRHKDVEAEVLRGSALAPFGLSFSAAGLLFPYHLGVTQCLIERGVLTSSVPLAGASAGAIVCATIAAGVGMREALEHTKALAADCRANGTAFRLGAVLREILQSLLPEDAHKACSGRIRVAVTQVFGSPRGLLVDQFDSKEDLINALFTSSFIPGYLAPSPITRFRNRICVDGGLTLFIPPTASHHTVRVCAFPGSSLGLSNVAISPDVRGREGRSMRQLFEWALEPAEDQELDMLFEEGYTDADAWLRAVLNSEEERQLILPGSHAFEEDWRRLASTQLRL